MPFFKTVINVFKAGLEMLVVVKVVKLRSKKLHYILGYQQQNPWFSFIALWSWLKFSA